MISARTSPKIAVSLLLAASVSLLAGCAADLDRSQEYFTSGGSTDASGGASASGGSSAGGSTSGGAPTIPPDPDCATRLITSQCASVCHSQANAGVLGGGLDLSGKNLGQRLSTAKSANCSASPLIIDAANPSNSLLLKKLDNTQGSCGTAMPPGTTGLSGADLTCIQTWFSSF